MRRMHHFVALLAVGSLPLVWAAPSPAAAAADAIQWLTDYGEARCTAEEDGKMLLLYFYDADQGEQGRQCKRFEDEVLSDAAVRQKLGEYLCARFPLDAKIECDGKEIVLLEHAAFTEMQKHPGIAILDFAHPDLKCFGHVVSAFPLAGRLSYTAAQMAVVLDLPPGTLTQRTMIYAVRIHPDGPASTQGSLDPYLLEEAESASQYQAAIRRQGHHRWEMRFPRINARLPRGLTATEVCAESWPGENLVEAAIECVRCWRCSSGHWSAVRSWHRVFGYDMKRGPNGIWYATGIFGRG